MNEMIYSAATESDRSRFFNRVGSTDFSDEKCHNWPHAISGNGYGYQRWGNQVLKASRIMWALWNERDIPDGMEVMHSCDNPRCLNPKHLSLGSHACNMRDMSKKCRSRNRYSVRTLGYIDNSRSLA